METVAVRICAIDSGISPSKRGVKYMELRVLIQVAKYHSVYACQLAYDLDVVDKVKPACVFSVEILACVYLIKILGSPVNTIVSSLISTTDPETTGAQFTDDAVALNVHVVAEPRIDWLLALLYVLQVIVHIPYF